MKTRKGFVSNSSSSSFIISDPISVFEIARKMMSCKERNGKALVARFDKLIKINKDYIWEDLPVMFTSINYNTFIRKDYWDGSKKIIIDTCTNENWDPALVSYKKEWSEAETDYSNFYWFIEYDILCKQVHYSEFKFDDSLCKEHYLSYMRINNHDTIGCPKCFEGKTFTQINSMRNIQYKGLNIREYKYWSKR